MGLGDVEIPQSGQPYKADTSAGYGLSEDLAARIEADLDALSVSIEHQRAVNADLQAATAVVRSGTDVLSQFVGLVQGLTPMLASIKQSVIPAGGAQAIQRLGGLAEKAQNALSLLKTFT